MYPGLRYAHKKINFASKKDLLENVCLRTKINLRVKKKTKKNLGQIQNNPGNFFVSPSKKTLVIQFRYVGVV